MGTSWHRCISVLALVAWLGFLGVSVWNHAERSGQPPIYDASTYYLKARNFWASVHEGRPFNPLNTEPVFRPPGTVAMSYPFGFHMDYRGFYFRSVFIPILLLAASVVIAGRAGDSTGRSAWFLALAAAFVCTLPAFFYFEVSPAFSLTSYWGLVDNFLGGMAALATAAAVRSVGVRSFAWVIAMASLAGFCILIKPAGVIVMVLVDAAWFGLGVLRCKSEGGPEGRKTARWLAQSAAMVAVAHLVVISVAMSSRYLSPENLAYGGAAVAVMKGEWKFTWDAVRGMLQTGPGYVFVGWLLLAGAIAGRQIWRMPAGTMPWSRSMLWGLALASILTLVFAAWFATFGSGGASRYGIPFVLMAAILALPVVSRATATMSAWQLALLALPMAASIANLAALLSFADPSIAWQKWSGVNVTSGQTDPAVAQARDFAGIVERAGRNVVLYSMPTNAVDGVFQASLDNLRIARPSIPEVTFNRPIDWQRPSVFRTGEMVAADYWLFRPVRDPGVAGNSLARTSVDSYVQERAVIEAWATRLTEHDGVAVVSDTPSLRVLRVVNRGRLQQAIDALVDGREWSAVFREANPKRRWTEEQLAEALTVTPPRLEHVRFGDQIELRALSATRKGNSTTVRIWWRPLADLKERDWIFFIHEIDGSGNILLNSQIVLDLSNSEVDALRYDEITLPMGPPISAGRLAVGFYRNDRSRLVANEGTRDWNDTRVIVSIGGPPHGAR